MLFFSPWLNAITRGEYLYFIILLKLIEGSWMYKVLESVTLDTQHVISWMYFITHELDKHQENTFSKKSPNGNQLKIISKILHESTL